MSWSYITIWFFRAQVYAEAVVRLAYGRFYTRLIFTRIDVLNPVVTIQDNALRITVCWVCYIIHSYSIIFLALILTLLGFVFICFLHFTVLKRGAKRIVWIPLMLVAVTCTTYFNKKSGLLSWILSRMNEKQARADPGGHCAHATTRYTTGTRKFTEHLAKRNASSWPFLLQHRQKVAW